MNAEGIAIRSHSSADEKNWLRCRAFGFLATAYFDDVLTKKATYDGASVELVADSAGAVVGFIDVAIEEGLATIETVAARNGIGRLLLGRSNSTDAYGSCISRCERLADPTARALLMDGAWRSRACRS